MRFLLCSILLLSLSAPAFAFKEGTYACRNVKGLPNNTYKIQMMDLGSGVTLPYVEVHKFFPGKDANSPQRVSIQGLAVASTSDVGERHMEILSIASMRLEFAGDNLVGCKE